MTDQDRFADLWTDYLEGELDATGMAELGELLSKDESLVVHAADLLQSHRLLGLLVAEEPAQQDHFVHETLAQLPESGEDFVSHVMAQVHRGADVQSTGPPRSKGTDNESGGPHTSGLAIRITAARIAWTAIAMAGLVVLIVNAWPNRGMNLVQETAPPHDPIATSTAVRLTSSSHAKFYGELSPPVGAALASQRDYVLLSGLVEVSYPTGATAILEGPALFRVLSNESLALDIGRCSVHAPKGAEGFHIETPVTRVVDRGTRFTVRVGETSDTEVHVIEGAADVYDLGQIGHQPHRRLTDGEAGKFVGAAFATDVVPFDASTYRRELPDRVVSYQTTQGPDGGAENLISVTVQRGGKVTEIPVQDLIGSHVSWFKSVEPRAYLCGPATLPSSRVSASSDHSLVTGVINPDGSVEPLTTDPVMEDGGAGTPGMAIQFERPVVNGPGADVVFFDLQTFSNPPDGDPFHVSPLAFRDGLHSLSIRRYDLTMESPEAQDLTGFFVHFFDDPVDSLAHLESLNCSYRKQGVKFRALVVGIDLSDLGYAVGEKVEGLFIQDALDDSDRVDPVLIAGLPESN